MIRIMNLDAGESIFFARELEHVMGTVFKKEYPELKATRLLPVTTEAGPTADVITYTMWDEVGIAKMISNFASDFPRVDVFGKEYQARVRSFGDSYGFNFQEARTAAALKRPLQNMRAIAARDAFELLLENLAWFGDASCDIGGLLRNPNITKSAAPDGAGSDTRWAPVAGVTTKTAAEIIEDVNALINGIKGLTKGIEAPDTLLLPVDEYAHIATTPHTTGDTTILEFLQRVHRGVTFEELAVLADVSPALVGGADSSNVMVAYKKDPTKLALHVPQPFEQLRPFDKITEVIVNCHGRIGGVVIYKPLSVSLMEGI